MPNTCFQITGTGASIANGGVAWSSATNVQALDGNNATANLSGLGTVSNLIRCTNFNFVSLDPSDTVAGITVVIDALLISGSSGDAHISVVQLWDGSATEGDDQATGGGGSSDDLTTTLTRYIYGGPTELSNGNPTIAEIQATGWGVQIECTRTANEPGCSIDAVQIAIHTTQNKAAWDSRIRNPGSRRSPLRTRS